MIITAIALGLLLNGYISLIDADSILEMIDTQEVEKLVAQRRLNNNSSFRELMLEHNLLEEGDVNELPEPSLRNTSAEVLQAVRQGGRLLRSRQAALLIARRQLLRKDWCHSQPLQQVIREDGCAPVTMLNHFCYGQCNSFYIPNNTPRKGKAVKGEADAAFTSCAFCKPKRPAWVTVSLRCRKQKIRRKRVLRVKQCRCAPA